MLGGEAENRARNRSGNRVARLSAIKRQLVAMHSIITEIRRQRGSRRRRMRGDGGGARWAWPERAGPGGVALSLRAPALPKYLAANERRKQAKAPRLSLSLSGDHLFTA